VCEGASLGGPPKLSTGLLKLFPHLSLISYSTHAEGWQSAESEWQPKQLPSDMTLLISSGMRAVYK